jgi:hypothetical protein
VVRLRKWKFWVLCPVVIAGLTTAIVLLSDQAEARRGKGYYSQQYKFDRPLRGYEGWVFPGYYCTYKRYPRRVCHYDKRGRERCRIAGWTLEQICY